MLEAREEATKRMVNEAVALGANAVVSIRFNSGNITHNASEIYVYGKQKQINTENYFFLYVHEFCFYVCSGTAVIVGN
jgi:hypothetical protein